MYAARNGRARSMLGKMWATPPSLNCPSPWPLKRLSARRLGGDKSSASNMHREVPTSRALPSGSALTCHILTHACHDVPLPVATYHGEHHQIVHGVLSCARMQHPRVKDRSRCSSSATCKRRELRQWRARPPIPSTGCETMPTVFTTVFSICARCVAMLQEHGIGVSRPSPRLTFGHPENV